MGQGARYLANVAFSAALVSASATAKSATPTSAKASSTVSLPDGPPVPLKVALTDSGPDDEWELTVQNASSVPIRLFDDPRILTLEVTTPGKKPTVCKLPDELFPKAPTSTAMKTLKPGESVHHKLDPRFYCFSPGAQQVLLPSAQVTPHYGFPSKTRKRWKGGKQIEEKLPETEPFVAEPVDDANAANTPGASASGGPDALGPAKNATGDAVVLDSRYAAWSDKPPHTGDGDDDDDDLPTIEMVKGSDAQSEPNVTATVRIRNPLKHKLVLFLRRELLTFEVLTPAGTISCSAEPDARNPDRRAFSTIARGGSVTLVSRLVELCPRGTFATPGLYLVHAQLDAPADGADYGLDAFTGTLHTERPIPVRVRRALQIIHNRPIPVAGSPGAPPQPGAPMIAPMPPPPMQPPQEAPPPPPPPTQ